MKPDAGSTCQCDNSDDKLRIQIYREAWRDSEGENVKLREENRKKQLRITELEDCVVRLQQQSMTRLNDGMGLGRENELLRSEIETHKIHKTRYQEEILDLEKHNEELFAILNAVRNTLIRTADDIEVKIRVD